MTERKLLTLRVVSPERTVYEGTVKRVTLPGELGSFTILPGHAPLISSLKSGEIRYVEADDAVGELEMQSGFVEVSDAIINVCVEQ